MAGRAEGRGCTGARCSKSTNSLLMLTLMIGAALAGYAALLAIACCHCKTGESFQDSISKSLLLGR
jgi:hypothetical protein